MVWLQLSPISTHRPTQGINAAIVEPRALQIESGYQPFWNVSNGLAQEGVLQVRMGFHQRWEGFITAGLASPPFTATPISLTIKGSIFQSDRLGISLAGWAYLPVAGHPAGGQLWFIADQNITAAGVLSVNLVGGYFENGIQGFLTTFYTHTLGTHWATWVEAFAYLPDTPGSRRERYGIGTGIQRLLGAEHRTAIDLAVNASLNGNIQLLVGFSQKARIFHRR